jgi:DNA-binding transcriptional MerR regulator
MTPELTAAEFAALTGLSQKALRLYLEREILPPAFVEPDTGYRYYRRAQVQEGQILDLLRRASVPVGELRADFDHAGWRERLALRRLSEDFYLDVAQQVAQFDPALLAAFSREAPEVTWAGVLWRFEVPDDVEDRIGAFSSLSADLPVLADVFQTVLAARHLPVSPMSWTMVPENPSTGSTQTAEMIIARPVTRRPSEAECRELTEEVRASSGEDVTVVTGVLPRRLEITFAPVEERELSPVEEAALDYQRLLAFEKYLIESGGTQIGRVPRPVLAEPAGVPITVFDVALES